MLLHVSVRFGHRLPQGRTVRTRRKQSLLAGPTPRFAQIPRCFSAVYLFNLGNDSG